MSKNVTIRESTPFSYKMNKLTKRFWICILLLSVSLSAQEDKGKAMYIPSEEEVGRVFIASLVATLAHAPPDRILVYPALYTRDGNTAKASDFCALIEGEKISEFLGRLAKPTQIASAEESCPNIIFCWSRYNLEPHKVIRPQLRGELYISAEADYVRVRLHTDNAIYAKIDFLYSNTGMKAWLQQRLVVSAGKSEQSSK